MPFHCFHVYSRQADIYVHVWGAVCLRYKLTGSHLCLLSTASDNSQADSDLLPPPLSISLPPLSHTLLCIRSSPPDLDVMQGEGTLLKEDCQSQWTRKGDACSFKSKKFPLFAEHQSWVGWKKAPTAVCECVAGGDDRESMRQGNRRSQSACNMLFAMEWNGAGVLVNL